MIPTEHLEQLADRFIVIPSIDVDVLPTLTLTDELRIAKYILSQHHRDGTPTLRHYRGDWYEWAGCWRRLEPQELTERIYRIGKRYLVTETAAIRGSVDKPDKIKVPTFGRRLVGDVTLALQSLVAIHTAPAWADDRKGRWLAFADNILDLDAWLAGEVRYLPQTPAYFAPYALSYPLEYTEAEPTAFLAMLAEQISQSEVDCIQEFGGYCMIPDTDIQRAIYLYGPPRSGKGTTDRTIQATIGDENCATKTLKAFNSPHAMEDLPGKTLLSLSDQRSSDKVTAEALERLLSIVGQDRQSINPKGKPHFSATLDCKLLISSNVLLDFHDDTGAALARFLFIETTKSHADDPDPTLLKRILEQRNELTWWFLRGLQRLLQSGKYTEPQNGLRKRFQTLNSPVKTFVGDKCSLSGETVKSTLYDSFVEWCDEQNVAALEHDVFFRTLYDTYPTAKPKQGRNGGKRLNLVGGLSLKGAA